MLIDKILIALAITLLSSTATASDQSHNKKSAPAAHTEHPHWSYEGVGGPDKWGNLDASYSACSSGKNQSPINLTDLTEATLAPIRFDYKPGGNLVVNNGHTIQVNYVTGSSITVNGRTFELKQFHAHAPSENRINGKSFPMEIHFVHADANGNLAVVAVMYETGGSNPELEKAWKIMPKIADEKSVLRDKILGTSLMPRNRDYYRFTGSLTTPPCSEGVIWLVLKSPASISQAQIDQFTQTMHHDNNRPVQPVNARLILE